MRPGDVVRLTHFMHHEPGLQTHWKAPKDRVFLAVLIGVENKDGSEPANPLDLMNNLGWELRETEHETR